MLGCDLCGPFLTGEHLLICVDYYSRYPDVEIVHKINATTIVSKLRKLFSRYGTPEVLVTDNGPQFISTEMKSLLKEFNIHHHKVTPYHPAAYGEVERFNRTIKKCIQAAIAEHKDWRKELDRFLMNYRNTPHPGTGFSPSQLMFHRSFRDKLPTLPSTKTPLSPFKTIKQTDCEYKCKMKRYSDRKASSKVDNVKPGDLVLIKNLNKHRDKYTSTWNPTPFPVMQTKGNTIFMKKNQHTMLRYRDQVKPYHSSKLISNQPHIYTSDNESTIVSVPIASDTDDNENLVHPASDISDNETSNTTIPYQMSDIDTDDNESLIHPASDISDSETSNTTIPYPMPDIDTEDDPLVLAIDRPKRN